MCLLLSGALQWEPARLDMIDDGTVDRYFAKMDDAGWEDLKLPERRNSISPSMSKL